MQHGVGLGAAFLACAHGRHRDMADAWWSHRLRAHTRPRKSEGWGVGGRRSWPARMGTGSTL